MKAINKRLKAIVIVCLAVAILAAISGLVWYLLQPKHNLLATFISEAPKMDGKLNDTAWTKAEPLVVETEKGPEVELRALYSSQTIYVSARYRDATKDDIHSPWTFDGKTWRSERKADGLTMFFESGDSIQDFDTKGFDVMNPDVKSVTDIYQFNVSVDKTTPGDASGSLGRADIWIMGSGITSPFGRADDAWFGADASYLTSPSGRKAELFTQWDQFTTLSTIRLNTAFWQEAMNVSEGKPGKALTQDGPYLKYKDNTINLENTPYPVESDLRPIADNDIFNKGDTLPLVFFNDISPGLWGGSRDDVTGKMTWQDGWWNIEMSRSLNTGHDDDIVFKTGEEDSFHFGIVVRVDGKNNRYSVPATLYFNPKGGK